MTDKRLIDADALKEIALKRGYSVRIDKYTGRWPCLLVADIANVPTVDAAEVVHGQWVNIVDYGDGNCYGFCSACAAEQKAQSGTALKASHRYCRWCGAKMDGGVEDGEID